MSNAKEIKRYRKGIKKIMNFHKNRQSESWIDLSDFIMHSYTDCALGTYNSPKVKSVSCIKKFEEIFGFESSLAFNQVPRLRANNEYAKALVVGLFSTHHGSKLSVEKWLKIAKDVRKQLKGMIEE